MTWVTPEEMEEHWEQICRWKNREPQFAAEAPGKGATTDGDDTRPVIFVLSSNQTGKQHKPKTPALPGKEIHMKKSEAFPSKYLKAADLNGEDLTAVISSLEWEAVGMEKTEKPVLYFRGKVKPLIVNGTNWDSIVEVTGEDESDNWEGKKITMFVDEVKFGSQMVDAIRIRKPKSTKKSKPELTQPPADDDVAF